MVKKPSLLTWCLLFAFVDSETLKLDHFDEAGYTFIAPRLVNFPLISLINKFVNDIYKIPTSPIKFNVVKIDMK